MQSPTQVVIIGAGYAGMMTAVRLAGRTRRKQAQITLVNQSDVFVERVRLHETATGSPPKTHRIAKLLKGTRVNFVHATVQQIDREHRSIRVSQGDDTYDIHYDYLIFALGSQVDTTTIPGIRDHAYVLNPIGSKGVTALFNTLSTVPFNTKVLVVGGGATGIEVAGEIKHAYPKLQVEIVTQGKFGTFKERPIVEKYMRQILTNNGITIREYTIVTHIEKGQLHTDANTSIPFDICVWAGGFTAHPMAEEAGLSINAKGQIITTPWLQATQDQHVFAVGDALAPTTQSGAPMRMSVFVAAISGAHAADTLRRIIRGQTPKPFSFAWYGQAVALGGKQAVGFLTFPNDYPARPIFRGRVAYAVRGFFVWYLRYVIRLERRFPGKALVWFGKGRYKRHNQPATTANPGSLPVQSS